MEEPHTDDHLGLKLGMSFAILIGSMIAGLMPYALQLFTKIKKCSGLSSYILNALDITQGFAGGVLLSTGLIHLLGKNQSPSHTIAHGSEHAAEAVRTLQYEALLISMGIFNTSSPPENVTVPSMDVIGESYPYGFLACGVGLIFILFLEKTLEFIVLSSISAPGKKPLKDLKDCDDCDKTAPFTEENLISKGEVSNTLVCVNIVNEAQGLAECKDERDKLQDVPDEHFEIPKPEEHHEHQKEHNHDHDHHGHSHSGSDHHDHHGHSHSGSCSHGGHDHSNSEHNPHETKTKDSPGGVGADVLSESKGKTPTQSVDTHQHDHNDHDHPHVHVDIDGLKSTSKKLQLLSGFILWISLVAHSIFEGLGVGAAREGVVELFVAILAHHLIACFALGSVLCEIGLNFLVDLFFLISFALSVPVGVWIGIGVSAVESPAFDLVAGLCLSVASGAFLYVACFEILAHFNPKKGLIMFAKMALFLFGFALMAILAIWA